MHCHDKMSVARLSLFPCRYPRAVLCWGLCAQNGRMHFYQAARVPDKTTCEHHLDKIEELNPGAAQKMKAVPRETWAMYATRGNVVWDQVTSNMAESTNHAMGAEVSCTYAPSLFFVAVDMHGHPAPILPCGTVVMT